MKVSTRTLDATNVWNLDYIYSSVHQELHTQSFTSNAERITECVRYYSSPFCFLLDFLHLL
jgi:hypothetical protein